MPKWTDEQLLAINEKGKNIVVSAGAGSGKTAVLTERVTEKLRNGINVNELLVLTFTNASAFEMKDRIKKSIEKNPDLSKQLELIDQAYITTFDSYALSMVKRFHYLLNISKNVSIIDSSLITLEKKKIIEEIFLDMYSSNDLDFLSLIRDFCLKDDNEIKQSIIKISDKLDLKYDKKEYLDSYLTNYFNEEKINQDILSFEKLLIGIISNIKNNVDKLSYYVDSNYYNLLLNTLNDLLNSTTYDEIVNNFNSKIPSLPKNSEIDAKLIKDSISSDLKKLSEYLDYSSSEEIKECILSSKKYVQAIIKIINKLDEKIDKFKYLNDSYEFTDISKMAIRILKENEDVRILLKNYFKEIMIDEYQDTSDLQEEFISLIENNNVYMVGDIKQSIYRFRNANPYIFKDKYDRYAKGIGGMKIDLNKNFRSRKETLDSINVIFDEIMNDTFGGADYKKGHQMVFGNNSYIELGSTKQNNNLEIYNYVYDKDLGYTREEIEIFTIAKDIKEKIDNNYQVFDKNTSSLRDLMYKDVVILIDRTSKFDLYKKIFEYMGIPLVKHTDTTLTDKDDIKVFKNILTLLISVSENNYDVSFKYAFTSVARSYLFRYSDEEIFNCLNNNMFNNSLIDNIKDIISNMSFMSLTEILDLIIEKFDIYSNLIKIGDIESSTIRLEYLYNIASNLEKLGYDIKEFTNYLNNLIEEGINVSVNISENIKDSVNIMTIHKSKGLEYPLCYYSGLHVSFNISDTIDKFLFDNKYGIITPYFKEGIGISIYKHLFKENYLLEEISEKIRLFYVALTRSREKMIIVTELINDKDSIDKSILLSKSFLDFLKCIKDKLSLYITNVDLKKIDLSKKYMMIKESNYQENIKEDSRVIEFIPNNIEYSVIKKERYSKANNRILEDQEISNIEFGIMVHKILEELDFKDNNIKEFNLDSYLESIICKIFDVGLDFKNAKIYKEYEFMYDDVHHGIIDLMLEYDDEIKIIDYKLKNIDDANYIKQLKGYKEYIKLKSNKKVETYLYSIMEGYLKRIN